MALNQLRISSLLILNIFLIPIFTDAAKAEQASEFFISSLSNQRFESKKVNGPFVMSFFFVDCLPCRKEIP